MIAMIRVVDNDDKSYDDDDDDDDSVDCQVSKNYLIQNIYIKQQNTTVEYYLNPN